MKIYRICIMLIMALSLSGLPVKAQPISMKKEVRRSVHAKTEDKNLTQEQKVRKARQNLIRRENELRYEHEEISQIHNKIVELQKELLNAREALKIQFALDPEHVRLKNQFIRELRKSRNSKKDSSGGG